jgi:hypothetical protein
MLEGWSIVFALGPLMMFLRIESFDGIAYIIFPFLFFISLLVMRVVEKEMYEVTRRMMKSNFLRNNK